jgi:hypothetical protein
MGQLQDAGGELRSILSAHMQLLGSIVLVLSEHRLAPVLDKNVTSTRGKVNIRRGFSPFPVPLYNVG